MAKYEHLKGVGILHDRLLSLGSIFLYSQIENLKIVSYNKRHQYCF